MARPKKEESGEEIPSTKSAMSAILKLYEEDHYNNVQPKNLPISTGSLILDSYITIRSGSIVRLSGAGAELGKTSEAFVLADNFHKTFPKSKTIYIKAESRLSVEMQKRSGHKFVTNPDDWEYGTVFVFACNKFEIIAATLEDLLKRFQELGEQICIIWDSLDGTILKSDASKDVWGTEQVKVAGVPLLTKLLFKRFALPMAHYDALMIVTSQYSAAIKIDPYAKDVPRQVEGSGGSSIGHQSDYVLYYHPRYQGDYILEKPDEKPDPVKNKTLGILSTIEVRKSGTDVTGTKLKIPIARGRVGSAIWVEKEVVDMSIQFGHLTRKGAWFNFSEDLIKKASEEGVEIKGQHQGLNNVFEYVAENKNVFNWLLKEYKKVIAI
jgi:hypothetical protein